MFQLFNMRLFRNNNLAALQPYLEKMKNNELTLEEVLEEEDILQDLKSNKNSQFSAFFSNEHIRKLIDYATRLPKSEEQNIGYKYPFNATELLCSDNASILNRFMNEVKMGGDSDDEEEEKEEAEKENKDNDNTEEEIKKDENEENNGAQDETNKEQLEQKKLENTQNKKMEDNVEEPKKEEENKKEEEAKKEEDNSEKPKEELPQNKEEVKKVEEPQNKEEEKKEENKPKEEENKEEPKKEEEIQKVEEPKKEENEGEEEIKPKPEGEKKEVDKKDEEPKQEEEKKEDDKKEEPKKEEEKSENKQENAEEQNKEKEPVENQLNQEQQKEEEEPVENQPNPEENEKEDEDQEKENEEQSKAVITIYDNVDYFFNFLNESEETKTNYVLVGYFNKIFKHLLNCQANKIVPYIFDYPKKNEFDLLNSLVKNMNRKSMGEIVNKLLLFQEEGMEDFLPKRLELLERVFEELKLANEEDKYKCICSSLITVFYDKEFFNEFMKETKFLNTIYDILEQAQNDSKKLIEVLHLLVNIHENILKNFDGRVTTSLAQENPMDFLSMLGGMYGMEETTQMEKSPELDLVVEKACITLLGLIKKNGFNFINDLDDYSSKENSSFMATYQKVQKKLGMKKLAQIEFFRTILDLVVNVHAKYDDQVIKDLILDIIKSAQEKKLFWKMHQLFLEFPFCNIYQTYYNQIMDIVLNERSPEELVKSVLIEKDEKGEKNLVLIFMDKMLKEMEFKFNSGRKAFHPNYSYEISILTKIIDSTNEFVKEIIKDNKNLSVFDSILGQDINSVFNQKLLYTAEKDNFQMGNNTEPEKEAPPLQYFCNKNIMQVLQEDNDIYSIYLKGGDYEKILQEKKEREKNEQEERRKLNEEGKKIIEDTEEDIGLGNPINDNNDNNENNEEPENNQNENNEEQDINQNENPFAVPEVESSSEENEEEKMFNDVNYWETPMPDEQAKNDALKDLDLD